MQKESEHVYLISLLSPESECHLAGMLADEVGVIPTKQNFGKSMKRKWEKKKDERDWNKKKVIKRKRKWMQMTNREEWKIKERN